MNSKKQINAQIQHLKITASEKLDTRIHGAINKSLAQAEKPDTGSIFMKKNIIKLAENT